MGRDSGFGAVFFAKPVISLVWYDNPRFFRVYSREGKVLERSAKSCQRISIDATYGRVSEGTFGDSLEESRLSDVCKANLNLFVSYCKFPIEHERTIPLFRLLPGLPSRIFSSLTAFLGGILLPDFALVVVMKTVQLSRL